MNTKPTAMVGLLILAAAMTGLLGRNGFVFYHLAKAALLMFGHAH